MVGIIGIIAALTVLGISLVITRIASTALSLTGLSWEAARFQARSAFTGTGFTTREAEKIVSHPLRRKIIMWLMIARSAGLLSIVISLILSFGDSSDDASTRLTRLIWLIGGVAVLWILANSDYLERWMRRVIKKALRRWTDLDVHDYADLLKEPLINYARSAFQSEKPQIVWCGPSDSSRRYGRGSQRARCGFCGETLRDGTLRAPRLVSARLFGTTKPRLPKPSRGIPQRPRRARA